MKRLMMAILFFTCSAQADLLSRVQLEEALRSRIKDVVQVFDPQAQILTHFSYSSYQGQLPGTDLRDSRQVIPGNIDVDDLRSVGIQIYTRKTPLPADLNSLVLQALPLPPSKIAIKVLELKSLPETVAGFSAEKIESLVLRTVQNMETSLWLIFGGGFLLIVGSLLIVGFFQSRRFSKEVQRLVQALGDLNLNGSAQSPLPAIPHTNREKVDIPLLENAWSSFEDTTLIALISDCYWTEEDRYGAWIWSRLNNEQKKRLMQRLPFMTDYSHFLSECALEPYPHVHHAYYLNPSSCQLTSQVDISQMVRSSESLWHGLSPLRQAHLPVRLEEKIQFSKSQPDRKGAWAFPISDMRRLSVAGQWGELTLEDESQLRKNPQSVPLHLRSQIKSLVWLGLLPEAQIREKLEKLDARTLATAWVGPQDLLQQLESYLPEKKRDLIREYQSRIPARRDSAAFNWLCEESLKDAAS